MKAVVEQALDSTWANAVTVRLEAELDNAHSLTTKEIATLMIHTMRTFIEEVRSENERTIFGQTEDPDRERARYQEMLRERDPREGGEAPDNVRGEREGS